MTDVVKTKDNTDVNLLRRRLFDLGNAFEEDALREINRMWEELNDLDIEIQEGMSNRVGSGFQGNEAAKYAYRLRKPVMNDTIQDLNGIATDLMTQIAGLVGEEFVADDSKAIGGLIGKANAKNFEMSELRIQRVEPPDGMPHSGDDIIGPALGAKESMSKRQKE
jgi:hypothetical protein